MSIAKTDIKLMASERLTDYYDGGGQMTGTATAAPALSTPLSLTQ